MVDIYDRAQQRELPQLRLHGRIGGDGFSSTAHVAALTRTPVVVVVDISRASRTIGAVVHGLATYDPSITVAGVILNRVGSARHEQVLRQAAQHFAHLRGQFTRRYQHQGTHPATGRDEAGGVACRSLGHGITRRGLGWGRCGRVCG